MLRHFLLLTLLICSVSRTLAQAPETAAAPVDPAALVQKIQGELKAAFPPEDGKVNPSVPRGEFLHGKITNSAIYPGTENDFTIYVPAQYDPAKPACLLLRLDSFGPYEGAVLDNLIARKEVPVIIGVGISSGTVWKDPPGTPKRRDARHNRSYEFDSVNDHFPDFVLHELLPAVQKMTCADGRAIHLSTDGNDHAATGSSTGGIGSFTLAWRRPDQFTRIFDGIGTFVSMRGGHEYPALVRKTEPKAIRVFLEDGSKDAWNPLFGSWYDANVNLESALAFAGCDVAHAWGTHGHDGNPGKVIFPDVMRWLWRDYPSRIKAGQSQNSALREILPADNAGWQKIDAEFQGACGLAADAQGKVYLSDAPAATVFRLGADDKPAVFARGSAFAAEGFGPDGTLYGVDAPARKIVAFDAQGLSHVVAEGIAGRGILVTHGGAIYISEPGEHSDMPSRIWQIKPGGEKKIIDEGLLSASGIAFAPDGGLFFAAEKTTRWIYSYVAQPDGTLADKQPYYWLHITDIPNDSGAEEIAVDAHGDLYVATRMGVQMCDQNGRVRAILPLPTPSGPVRSLCFGGEHFNTLYVTDGKQVFKRVLRIPGCPPWEAPKPYPSEGGS